MKLTNFIRDAFVSSAVHDIPKDDFKEAGVKIITEAAVRSLPPKVRAIYDDKDLRHFLTNGYFDPSIIKIPNNSSLASVRRGYGSPFHRVFGSINIPGPQGTIKLNDEDTLKLVDLAIRAEAQDLKIQTLTTKLKGVAYSVTTRKALATLLPEFSKYLPPEIEGVNRNVPAVTDVLTEFVRAGWPKNETT